MAPPKPPPKWLLDLMAKIDPGYFYFVFLFFKTIFDVVNTVTELLAGYSIYEGSAEDRLAAQSYERSAHVVSLWGRGAYSFATAHKLKNFLGIHKAYVHPKYILENEHVTFHGVDKDKVWFCVSHPEMDVYDLKAIPFAFIAQYLNAQELVIMSHHQVHKLAEELGDPEPGKAVLLTNTARCGSTLLCKMMQNVPDSKGCSEPWGLLQAHGMRNRGEVSQVGFEKLVKSLVRLQFKDCRTKSKVLVKLPFLANPIVKVVKKVCPSVKHIFVTRHPKPSIVSFVKVMTFDDYDNSFYAKYEGADFWYSHLPFPYDSEFYKTIYEKYYKIRWDTTPAQSASLAFVASLASYLELKHLYSYTLVYEDILKDKEPETKRFLKAIDVSEDQTENAMKGFKGDSQNGMFKNTSGSDPKNVDSIGEKGWTEIKTSFTEMRMKANVDMSLDEYRELVRL